MKVTLTVRRCAPRVAGAFKFRCPRTWDSLAPTDDPSVRSCGSCEQPVYLCTTDEETLRHAEADHCIARAFPSDDELPEMFLGQPSRLPLEPTAEQLSALEWSHREDGIEAALDNGKRYATKPCPDCGYPVPSFRSSCYVCRRKVGRR